MPFYILPARKSFTTSFCEGLAQSVSRWAHERAMQQAYEEQIATQVAAQQRLMEIAHQQRLQEMAYQQQLESQKRTVIHHEKITHSTNEIGLLSGSVIVFCVIAILFIAGMATLISIKSTNKI